MTACTHCGTDLPGGLKFCKQCGTPVAAIRTEAASAPCRNCHAALTPNQRFCNKCGTPVASVNDAGAIDAEVPASPAGRTATRTRGRGIRSRICIRHRRRARYASGHQRRIDGGEHCRERPLARREQRRSGIGSCERTAAIARRRGNGHAHRSGRSSGRCSCCVASLTCRHGCAIRACGRIGAYRGGTRRRRNRRSMRRPSLTTYRMPM